MRVAISEAHTKSCVSHQWYHGSRGEGGRLLLRVRVILIFREGHMALCTCKAYMYRAS